MIAILGAGITGLSIAHELKKRGIPFQLFEADAEAGGKIKSTSVEGYVLEMGPNTVLINNKEIKNVLAELGLLTHTIQPDSIAIKNRYILFENTLEKIPLSFGESLESRLISWSTLFRILREPFIARKVDKEESLANFSRRRFGAKLYQNFIYPFVSGIYAGDPEKMSSEYNLKILKDAERKSGSVIIGMIKLLKAKKKENEPHQLPKEKIFTFKEGLAVLIKRLVEENQNQIQLSTKVLRIEKTQGKYLLELEQSGTRTKQEFSKIISTLPSPVLADLIQEMNPDFASQLKKINYVPAIVMHLAYPKGSLQVPEKAFGILSREKEDVPFLGVLFSAKFFPHTAPEGQELLTVISGSYKQMEMIKLSDDQLFETIRQSLEKLLSAKVAPKLLSIKRWNNGIPQMEMGYGKIEETIKDFEQKEQGFYIAGNFINGVAVSDCISNGVKLAQKISQA